MRHLFRRPRLLGAALALGLCGVLGTLSVEGALAAYTVCRVDPTVTLSNGAVVTMYADVQDTVTDIKSVTYNLHGPKGTSVKTIGYDALGYLEKVQYTADQPANVYNEGTTVTTGVARIKFSAYVTASKGGAFCSRTQKSGGISGVTTWIQFHC